MVVNTFHSTSLSMRRDPHPKQVLLVDDDQGVLKLYGIILEREGFEVLRADGAPMALSLLDENTPDLLIIDVVMPGTDGIELSRQIRTRLQTAQIPIIILSSIRDPETIQTCFDIGANAYLFKPILPRDLVTKTHSMLNQEVTVPIEQ